jgi:hypothetical protein
VTLIAVAAWAREQVDAASEFKLKVWSAHLVAAGSLALTSLPGRL